MLIYHILYDILCHSDQYPKNIPYSYAYKAVSIDHKKVISCLLR